MRFQETDTMKWHVLSGINVNRTVMRLSWLGLLPVSLGSLAAETGVNDRYQAWQAKHPFTQSAWATHRYEGGEEVDMPYFVGSGLNTFWDGVRSGSEGSKHSHTKGLPTLLMGNILTLDGFVADFTEAQKAHSNLVGVILGDEVEPERAKGIRGIRDWIVDNKDPRIASLITVSSVPGMSLEDYGKLKEALQPDVFLFQHYPGLRGKGWQTGYFSTLEQWSTWTRDNGVGFWIYPRVYSGDFIGIASESELRLQRFTALAYGVKGLVDFMWSCQSPPSVAGAGYWDGSGKPTPMYKFLAPINREIAHLARSLVCLRPVGAYHLNKTDAAGHFVRHWMDPDLDRPAWLRRTWKLVNVTGTVNRNNLAVGFFRDDAGQEYFMVVNKECAAGKTGEDLATEVNLTFHPTVKAIQRLRRSDGTVERIAVDCNYRFLLPGGTGDLFKFDDGAPFAGIEPVVLPTLTGLEPAENSTLPGMQDNRLTLNFDRDASTVSVEIRELASDNKPGGDDLGDSFTRSLTNDNRTVIYRENGQAFKNKRKYHIRLHGSKTEKPIPIRTCRGDVDGDGNVTPKDLAIVQHAAQKSAGSDPRADLNADGVVDDADTQILSRLLQAAEKFRWVEDFEGYPTGPLVGQGPWLATESLPARVFTKAVVQGPATITTGQAALHGTKKLQGGAYPDYRGNEAVFRKQGGFGDSGVLRLGFMARLGTGSVERMDVSIANSRDAAGTTGVLNCQVVEDDCSPLFTSRGVELVDGSDGPKGDIFKAIGARQGPQGAGVQVEVVIDFDAKSITWECQNLQTKKQFGPRTVHYKGQFDGLDSISFWVCGQETQMDHIWIQNY